MAKKVILQAYLSRSDLAYLMKDELGHLPYLALGFECNLTMLWDEYAKQSYIQLIKDIVQARADFRANLPQEEIKPMRLSSKKDAPLKQLSLFRE